MPIINLKMYNAKIGFIENICNIIFMENKKKLPNINEHINNQQRTLQWTVDARHAHRQTILQAQVNKNTIFIAVPCFVINQQGAAHVSNARAAIRAAKHILVRRKVYQKWRAPSMPANVIEATKLETRGCVLSECAIRAEPCGEMVDIYHSNTFHKNQTNHSSSSHPVS